MSKRTLYTATLAILLLGVVTVTSGLWQTGSFSHGEPGFDQGCYCHNNGIAIYVNGTGDGNGGVFFGPITAGSSFHLYITTNNVAATGVVPGLQQWQSNQTDNSKFTFSPTQVTDGSAQDRSPTSGNITALYKITAPTTAGFYTLTLYAQGSEMQSMTIQVTGGSTSTSTTTTSSTTSSTASSTTSSTHTTSTTSSTSTTTTSSTTSTSTTSSHTTSTSTTSSMTSTTSTTSTTHSTIASSMTFTSPSPGKSFTSAQSYTISGTISPPPSLPDNVFIDVMLQNSSTLLDFSTQAVSASGTFSYTTSIGGSSAWVTGTYVIAAVDSNSVRGTMTFQYTAAASTSTTTSSSTSSTTSTISTSTASSTTTSSSAPTTSSATSTTSSMTTSSAAPTTSSTTPTASTTTTQSTSSFPAWAYVVIGAILIVVVGAIYLVRRTSAQKAEGVGYSEQG